MLFAAIVLGASMLMTRLVAGPAGPGGTIHDCSASACCSASAP